MIRRDSYPILGKRSNYEGFYIFPSYSTLIVVTKESKGVIFIINIHFKKSISIMLFLLFMTTNLSINASEKLSDRYETSQGSGEESIREISYYNEYLETCKVSGYEKANTEKITIYAENYSDYGGEQPAELSQEQGKSHAIELDEKNQYTEWKIIVPKKGLYQINIEYYTGGGRLPISRTVHINGKIPFDEANSINLYKLFKHIGKPRENSLGDQVRPMDEQIDKWVTKPLFDSMGKYSTPLLFALEEGENIFRLEYVDQPLYISAITVEGPDSISSYKEVLGEYQKAGYPYAEEEIHFQAEGEQFLYKNNFSIIMYGDGDIYAQPKGVTNIKMNVMGGYSWKNGGQAITWEFNVPQTGLYKLAVRGAQFWSDGLPATRRIEIDNSVPYQEFLEYSFEYSRGSQTKALSDDTGQPYLLYLTQGRHELTMTVQLGLTAEIFKLLNDTIIHLSNTIRSIVMLTGSEPDVNYDYELDKLIPTLTSDLKGLSDKMATVNKMILSVSNKKPSMTNNFKLIQSQLDSMIDNPDSIPRKMKDLSNALTILGDQLNSVIEQPFMVDYFQFLPVDAKVINHQSNFFDKFIATMQNFFASFVKDYNEIGSFGDHAEINETLDVWITRGKEWGEILKELADSAFTPENGIQIRLNIMPSGSIGAGVNPLLLAINSRTAPDVGMGLASNYPVEYAIRNALVDLSKFSDFEEISNRFYDDILIPFTYKQEIYALPETMNARLMYYRTDIFEENNLKVPETWQEIADYLMPALYQKNMQIYIPQFYDIFLFQNGGQFYTQDGLRTALDSSQAYTSFRQLVELYTHFGVPVSANFFNRFRTGEMPIGIENLGFFMTVSYGAPELKGKWDIALIPGTVQEDGTIDRSSGGMAVDADVIIAQSGKQPSAWEFLKWWNSDLTQIEFASLVETRMGTQARWLTANKSAFQTLSWNIKNREKIVSALHMTTEQPVVLGGYFTTRHLTNALNRCIISHQPVRDSVEYMVEQINIELKRRQESQGIFAQSK